eukprot:TRINITY_DN51262_c0_g1_i1.p1 TRINITY_DN51262_c0_g1~~TRINITY_DN51262_c0_g1_i1.p1  ORF type:complete len:562 (-),score=84.53 TRINITY_DN51262_c0_g1_i1:303-1988(-)
MNMALASLLRWYVVVLTLATSAAVRRQQRLAETAPQLEADLAPEAESRWRELFRTVGKKRESAQQCRESLQPLLAAVRYKALVEAARKYSWTTWYARRWSSASQEKVLEEDSSNMTWGDITLEKAYLFERQRMTLMGRLIDERDRIIDSTVRGVCDMSLQGLKFFVNSATLLKGLKEVLQADSGCLDLTLKEMAEAAQDAMAKECLDSCLGTLRQQVEASMVPCGLNVLTQDLYQQVIQKNEQCAHMPYDNLEHLASYVMSQRCNVFVAPRPLYIVRDKAHGQISETLGEPTAVCTIPEKQIDTGNKTKIVQNGMCPEGSKCKCPMRQIRSRQTAMDIRLDKGQSIFAKAGQASVPAMMAQYSRSLLAATAKGMVLSDLTASASLVAALEIPTFLLSGSAVLGAKALYKTWTFTCASTVGCWPQRPDEVSLPSTSSACRLPEKTKDGGSPLWFLPPPMLRIHHHKGYCVLATCLQADYVRQAVGLGISDSTRYTGKPNINNCQPLIFEEMTPKQKVAFLERLRESGISEEYDISSLLSKYGISSEWPLAAEVFDMDNTSVA